MTPQQAACRQRIITKLTSLLEECEHICTDTHSWNNANPESRPFDTELGTLAIAATRRCLKKVVENQNCEVERQDMLDCLERYAAEYRRS